MAGSIFSIIAKDIALLAILRFMIHCQGSEAMPSASGAIAGEQKVTFVRLLFAMKSSKIA
jgi:hypothetical protein